MQVSGCRGVWEDKAQFEPKHSGSMLEVLFAKIFDVYS